MRFVIGAVKVDTVPASGEEDLSAHTVGAVVREEIGTFGPVGIIVMASAVVKADVTDGLVGEICGVVNAPVRIASKHSQSLRDRLHLFGGIVTNQIVYVKRVGHCRE